jgi:hypothetical protein
MRIREIPKLWKNNQKGRASKNFYTDGLNIYSYQLKIGYTTEYGEKVLLNFTTASGNFKSITTSRHVNLTAFHADRLEMPWQ